jgi:hypothetical protein
MLNERPFISHNSVLPTPVLVAVRSNEFRIKSRRPRYNLSGVISRTAGALSLFISQLCPASGCEPIASPEDSLRPAGSYRPGRSSAMAARLREDCIGKPPGEHLAHRGRRRGITSFSGNRFAHCAQKLATTNHAERAPLKVVERAIVHGAVVAQHQARSRLIP